MKNLDYLIHPFKEQLIENFFDGESGDKGLNGYVGETGEVGNKGLKGRIGFDGLMGAKGIPGEQGLQGDKGDPGDQGKPGPKGIKGDKGVKGPLGDIGYKGDLGERGDPGKRGVKGVKGEKGYDGERGDSGKQFSIYNLGNIDNKCNWRKVDVPAEGNMYLQGSCNEDEVLRGIKSNYWKTDFEEWLNLPYKKKWSKKWVKRGWLKIPVWWWFWLYRDETVKRSKQFNRNYEICCSKLPIKDKKMDLIELDETYDLSYPKRSDYDYKFYD